ncbi:UNKNOWN [Stylonychia lemnae]|uniref:Uncharacterized protein n=1 Tax=Stylonychia lemnae TaxID=5949 RepID=A0A078ARR1_STYLE|nr:UNKNOWN [Stylonychia lemnae]|eukprot:CDW85175.1 UNKNOWN [Stylonychia lemnae]
MSQEFFFKANRHSMQLNPMEQSQKLNEDLNQSLNISLMLRRSINNHSQLSGVPSVNTFKDDIQSPRSMLNQTQQQSQFSHQPQIFQGPVISQDVLMASQKIIRDLEEIDHIYLDSEIKAASNKKKGIFDKLLNKLKKDKLTATSMTPNLRQDSNLSKCSQKGYVAYSKRNLTKKNSSSNSPQSLFSLPQIDSIVLRQSYQHGFYDPNQQDKSQIRYRKANMPFRRDSNFEIQKHQEDKPYVQNQKRLFYLQKNISASTDYSSVFSKDQLY